MTPIERLKLRMIPASPYPVMDKKVFPDESGWETVGNLNGDRVQVKRGADREMRETAMHGHGSTYGSCGHKVGQCRCMHNGDIRRFRKEPCGKCAGGVS